MLNRWLVSMMACCALSAACLPEHQYQRPDPAEQKAAAARAAKERAAAAARAAVEQRFRDQVDAKQYIDAAQTLISELLVKDDKDRAEVTKLLAMYAGTFESGTPDVRCGGYEHLARVAKQAGLKEKEDVGQRYATSALRACVAVEDLDRVMSGALLAEEFNIELDLRWRAAARVWANRIDLPAWPDAKATAFVAQFPLTSGMATAAYTAASELGRWKAARMIAERAQLGEELFRAVRTKEIEELVAEKIRAHNDQGLLQLNLEAPGYVDASVVKTVAARVVTKLIEEGDAGEAYSLALAHGLDVEYAKRAADALFTAAIKQRAFSFARQMPDGTFIIVEQPPPPPTPPATPSTPSPPTQFGYGGGH
ncbi:MAG: hypothetical protein Q8R16_02830 [bacterium]|nr:hypothetical protein [bacterium]